MQSCLTDALFDDEPKELDQSLLEMISRHLNSPQTHGDMSQSWEWRQPLAANSDTPLENLDELMKTIEPDLFSPDKLIDLCVASSFSNALEPTPIKPVMFLYQGDPMNGLVNSQHDPTIVQSGKNRKHLPATDSRLGKHPNFRPYQHHQFQKRYEALLRFKAKHGHCLVPCTYEEDPTLASWVKRQRYQYKMKAAGKSESSMTEERISMLEAIGFIWDSHKLAWEDHMEELKLYKQEHGDCNVPSTYTKNPALRTWVKYVRRQFRRLLNGESHNITSERIAALDALGFYWKNKRNEFV